MTTKSDMWRHKYIPLRALILGCGGQDGSYMVELLLSKGYEVHGVYRRSSIGNLDRIAHIIGNVVLHRGDLSDGGSIDRIIRDVQPTEIYNLADQDNVRFSADTPDYSIDVTAGAVGRLLESVRQTNRAIKVFQPVTALMFGNAPPLQNELTPLNPLSPYAIAKTAAYHLCRYYRRTYGMFVSCGTLFNHDSPRRGEDYLLQKICAHAACVKERRLGCGSKPKLEVGGLDIWVDIGFAGDYVKAMHAVLQLPEPDDFVIGQGVDGSRRIRTLVEIAYEAADVGFDSLEPFVTINPDPNRKDVLLSDCTKIKKATGWYPETSMGDLIKMIVERYQR